MRVPPPVLMALAAGVQRAMTPTATARSPLRTAVAAGLLGGSIATAGAASRRFRRSGTTFEPFHPDRASVLVTTGANAVTRNPMYVGMAGLLVAQAVHRGSWAALLPAAAFVAVVDVYQVRFEEDALRTLFGADYDGYCAAVPRWLDARSVRAVTGRPGSTTV